MTPAQLREALQWAVDRAEPTAHARCSVCGGARNVDHVEECWVPSAYAELALFRDCLRCGHVWQIHGPEPQRCARCNSPAWNRPRRAPVAQAEA